MPLQKELLLIQLLQKPLTNPYVFTKKPLKSSGFFVKIYNFLFLVRNLSPLMIHVVFVPVNQLGKRNELITGFFQGCYHGIQCISRVFCPIMTKNNCTVSEMRILCDRFYNRVHTVIFPVQTVISIYRSKDFFPLFTTQKDSATIHCPKCQLYHFICFLFPKLLLNLPCLVCKQSFHKQHQFHLFL